MFLNKNMVTSDMDYKVSIVHLKAPLGDNVTLLTQPFGVQSDEGLTLKIWPIYIINSIDKTKVPRYTLPLTQHNSYFGNLPPLIFRSNDYKW